MFESLFAGLVEGRPIALVSLLGTAVFVAVTLPAALGVEALDPVVVAVSLALFAVGIALFVWSFAVAVNRSRTDAIGMGGLYFLAGETAPAVVRRVLLGALAVQVVVGVLGASLRPFTALAFGVLAPTFGLGAAGLWGARHGRFAKRHVASKPATSATKTTGQDPVDNESEH